MVNFMKDLTIYLNQVLNSLFNDTTDNTIHAPLKVVIDINTGGSGSGRTIFSGTGNVNTTNSTVLLSATADKFIFELNEIEMKKC